MDREPPRRPRNVHIADHLWELFEQMAAEMDADRDRLINQAMIMFARLNGYSPGQPASTQPVSQVSAPSRPSPRPSLSTPLADSEPRRRASEVSPAPRMAEVSGSAKRVLDEDPGRREVAARVLETADELERLIKGKGDGSEVSEVSAEGAGLSLYLMAESGELEKITKPRFVIGRGKTCDLVVNSGKVSREHAVVTEETDGYYIEDLGSSNGTWFNKQRIKRHKIEDGDEFYICSEKIKFALR